MWREAKSWSRVPGDKEVRGGRGGAQHTCLLPSLVSPRAAPRGGLCLWDPVWAHMAASLLALLLGGVLLTFLAFIHQ